MNVGCIGMESQSLISQLCSLYIRRSVEMYVYVYVYSVTGMNIAELSRFFNSGLIGIGFQGNAKYYTNDTRELHIFHMEIQLCHK